MSLADEILDLADDTRNGNEGRCRRSTSCSYYASFHRIIEYGYGNVLAPGLTRRFVRSFDHGTMRKQSNLLKDPRVDHAKEFGLTSSPSADLVLVAKNFGELQARRHLADYDTTRVYSSADSNVAFDLAIDLRNTISRLTANSNFELSCFVASMLLSKPRQD